MNPEVPFDSVESFHEFVTLLAQVVVETKREIEKDVQREMSLNLPRRLKALQIIQYKLRTLESHLENVRRILNDLRSLRRLLFGKRTDGGVAVPWTSIDVAKAETTPSSPLPEVSRSGVPLESTVVCDVSTYVRVKKRALSSSRAVAPRVSGDAIPWYGRRDIKPINGTATVTARR